MAIKKDILYYDQNGNPVCRFVIPNQTGDYVELSNLGCKISGIHIHKLDGIMENISSSAGLLLGGELGNALSEKLWTIAEEGENSVFFTYECLGKENKYNVDLQLGMKVTWVNLNRLIIDYFITPKEKINLDFSTNLDVENRNRDFFLCSFCPVVQRTSEDRHPVQETEYRNMSFIPVVDCKDRFIHSNDDMKPMIELSDKKSKLSISAYSTLSAVQVKSLPHEALSIVCSESENVELHAGETLVNRMIFGFDYIEDTLPNDAEPNPFTFFL
jgi:hypothetical protein